MTHLKINNKTFCQWSKNGHTTNIIKVNCRECKKNYFARKRNVNYKLYRKMEQLIINEKTIDLSTYSVKDSRYLFSLMDGNTFPFIKFIMHEFNSNIFLIVREKLVN